MRFFLDKMKVYYGHHLPQGASMVKKQHNSESPGNSNQLETVSEENSGDENDNKTTSDNNSGNKTEAEEIKYTYTQKYTLGQ